MKETTASLNIEVTCKCPNCGAYLDVFDLEEVKYALDETHNAPDCNLEIECTDCNETFLLTDIYF